MQIEAEKNYRTRGGDQTGILRELNSTYVDRRGNKEAFTSEMMGTYSADGKWITGGDNCEHDIVSEWNYTPPSIVSASGMKHDSGKPIAGIFFEEFPRALEQVSNVATFGADKYSRANWLQVDNLKQRYTDAMVRHMIAKGKGEINDLESGFPHSAHIAWCALALAEIEQRENDNV